MKVKKLLMAFVSIVFILFFTFFSTVSVFARAKTYDAGKFTEELLNWMTDVMKWGGFPVDPDSLRYDIPVYDKFKDTSLLGSLPSDNYLQSSKPYYTQPSIYSPSGAGSSGGGFRGNDGEYTGYAQGNTTNTSIVNGSYNNTTNNYDYSINIPTTNYNNITNNYYETYNIQNISYSTEYNVYNIQTVTNNNYYVTNSPTFVNITYLNSATNSLSNNIYYYQMPDGRNTFDLTADEVFGKYFVYDYSNYKEVLEDDGKTLALYHFDGNLKDSSAGKGTATYLSGASYNFMEHGAFNQALYWDKEKYQLSFSGSAGSTAEFMLYLTESGTIPVSDIQFRFSSSKVTTGPVVGSMVPRKPLSNYLPKDGKLTYSSPQIETYSGYSSSGGVGTHTYYYDNTVYYLAGYVLTLGGVGYFPIYEVLNIRETALHKGYSGTQVTWYVEQSYSITASSMHVGYFDSSNKFNSLSVGSWHSMAVSGGQTYVDGVPRLWYANGASTLSGNSLYKPSGWANYWMLDEFRMTNPSLYFSSYTPSTQPYDTNKVLVLPEDGVEGEFAVKSSIPIASLRIGGVRPTIPVVGDVFVSIKVENKKHTVDSVQIYDSGGWVSTTGSLYVDGSWKPIVGYDMALYTNTPIAPPGGGGGSSSSSGSSSSGSGSSSSGGGSGGEDFSWGNFFKAIGEFFVSLLEGLVWVATKLIEGLTTVVKTIGDAFATLTGFGASFGDFLAAAFVFIPPEILTLIVLALSLAIIRMIIQFFK